MTLRTQTGNDIDEPKPSDDPNNFLATGGLWMALAQYDGVNVEPVYEDDGRTITNKLIVRLHFLKSPYLVSVERIAEPEPF